MVAISDDFHIEIAGKLRLENRLTCLPTLRNFIILAGPLRFVKTRDLVAFFMPHPLIFGAKISEEWKTDSSLSKGVIWMIGWPDKCRVDEVALSVTDGSNRLRATCALLQRQFAHCNSRLAIRRRERSRDCRNRTGDPRHPAAYVCKGKDRQ